MQRSEMKLYVGLGALTNAMSERVKIGSVESKKGLLFFITALSFGFKWSVKRSLLKRLEQPNVTKQTIVV